MRGAHARDSSRRYVHRIIPADAGSTCNWSVLISLCQDHPRGCGEHHEETSRVACRAGSSPRMRGAPKKRHRSVFPGRIIPADAGSTKLCHTSSMIVKDHPRGCGEHYDPDSIQIEDLGSSPRMRGAQYPVLHDSQHLRIIPADAGSTFESETVRVDGKDHPRGCGEHRVVRIA